MHSLQYTNLHAMEFLLIFGETNFVEVQKSAKSVNFMALKERALYGILRNTDLSIEAIIVLL